MRDIVPLLFADLAQVCACMFAHTRLHMEVAMITQSVLSSACVVYGHSRMARHHLSLRVAAPCPPALVMDEHAERAPLSSTPFSTHPLCLVRAWVRAPVGIQMPISCLQGHSPSLHACRVACCPLVAGGVHTSEGHSADAPGGQGLLKRRGCRGG